jgi:hypothetical protein
VVHRSSTVEGLRGPQRSRMTGCFDWLPLDVWPGLGETGCLTVCLRVVLFSTLDQIPCEHRRKQRHWCISMVLALWMTPCPSSRVTSLGILDIPGMLAAVRYRLVHRRIPALYRWASPPFEYGKEGGVISSHTAAPQTGKARDSPTGSRHWKRGMAAHIALLLCRAALPTAVQICLPP